MDGGLGPTKPALGAPQSYDRAPRRNWPRAAATRAAAPEADRAPAARAVHHYHYFVMNKKTLYHLRMSSCWTLFDGTPCWCTHPPPREGGSHEERCANTRAALAEVEEALASARKTLERAAFYLERQEEVHDKQWYAIRGEVAEAREKLG